MINMSWLKLYDNGGLRKQQGMPCSARMPGTQELQASLITPHHKNSANKYQHLVSQTVASTCDGQPLVLVVNYCQLLVNQHAYRFLLLLVVMLCRLGGGRTRGSLLLNTFSHGVILLVRQASAPLVFDCLVLLDSDAVHLRSSSHWLKNTPVGTSQLLNVHTCASMPPLHGSMVMPSGHVASSWQARYLSVTVHHHEIHHHAG